MTIATGIMSSVSLNDIFHLIFQDSKIEIIVSFTFFMIVAMIGVKVISYLDTYRFSSYKSYNKRFLQRTKNDSTSSIGNWKIGVLQKWKPNKSFYFYIALILLLIGFDYLLIYAKLNNITSDSLSDLFNKEYWRQIALPVLNLLALVALYWISVTMISLLVVFGRSLTFAKRPKARIRRVKNK